MKTVSPFEENLIRILRAVLRGEGVDGVLSLLVREVPRPNCLGQDCVDIVQDDLTKGSVQRLGQWGGTVEKFLDHTNPLDGSPITGRLWERSTVEQRSLSFSAHTMDWLIWLTSVNFSQPAWLPKRPTARKPLQLGDRIFFLFLFDALQSTLGASVLVKHPTFREDGLLWLMYPDRFAEFKGEYRGDFEHWFTNESVWILEAVQSRLIENWTEVEAFKFKLRDPVKMQRLGTIQGTVLDHFFEHLEREQRRDLARFCLPAAGEAIHSMPVSPPPYSNLEMSSLKMADRGETYQAALALFHRLQRLQSWQQASTATSFYDEGYQASQFWKSEWERLNGDRICEEARKIVKQFELLPV